MAVVLEMPPRHFNTVIRLIKKTGLDRVEQLATAVGPHMKRLKAKRNPAKAVAGVPDGSDQVDLQSLFRWMEKLERKNRPAVKQLVAIDATVASRLGL